MGYATDSDRRWRGRGRGREGHLPGSFNHIQAVVVVVLVKTVLRAEFRLDMANEKTITRFIHFFLFSLFKFNEYFNPTEVRLLYPYHIVSQRALGPDTISVRPKSEALNWKNDVSAREHRYPSPAHAGSGNCVREKKKKEVAIDTGCRARREWSGSYQRSLISRGFLILSV